MKLRELFAVIPGTFSFQGFSINRPFLDADRCVVAGHARQHQREDDLIIECNLEDHDDGHDRRMRGGGEKCAHAHKRECAGIYLEMAKNVLRAITEEKAKARADEKRRSENAANRAGAESGGGSKDFEYEDHGDDLPDPLAT